MIKVLLADDHSIIRDGLKSMLATITDIEIAGEAANGEEVMAFLSVHTADVILMDISMPLMNGIETTRMVADYYPDIHVIALSIHEQYDFIKYMINAGAKGYVSKEAEKEELLDAIYTVYAGKKFYSDKIIEKLTSETKNNKSVLTEREKEILKLIAEELNNVQIAERLFLSVRTVDTHRRNIIQKLDVKNTAGMVKYAIKLGLI